MNMTVEQALQLGSKLVYEDKKKALNLAINLHKQTPKNLQVIGFLVYMYAHTGSPHKAVKLLEKSIKKLGPQLSLLADLCAIYKLTSNYKSLIKTGEKLIRTNTARPQDYIVLAEAYLKEQQLDNAAKHLKKCLELDPENSEAIYLLKIAQKETLKEADHSYVSEHFDGFAQTFEDTLVNKLDYKTPEKICDQFKKHAAENSEVIVDLGCGTGLCGPLLAPICNTLNGVDLSQKMLDKAEDKKLYKELACKDLTEYLNKQNNIDAAIAADVFVYIGDLEPIFKACHKALKEGGLFSFSVEKSEQDNFEALISGRFAHNISYLKKMAQDTNFEWLEDEETFIRKESGTDVQGYLITLKKRSE